MGGRGRDRGAGDWGAHLAVGPAARAGVIEVARAGTAGLSFVAFRFGEPSALLFLPLLAWAAFRLGDLGVILAGTAFAVVANYMTAAGYGEFAGLGLSSPASLALTQAYIATVVLLGSV